MVWQSIPPFHAILKPLHDKFVPETQEFLDGVGLTRSFIQEYGLEPLQAMKEFEKWLFSVAPSEHEQLVFVHFGGKDWNFVDWYLWHFLGRNPFGFSACDIKSFARGRIRCSWENTLKSKLPSEWRSELPHTHRAHEDAMEHAERYRKIWQIDIE